MASMQLIQEFLALKRIAVVGVSHRPQAFSRTLFRELKSRGYDVVPVNPSAHEIDGLPCYARMQEISPPVEGVLMLTPPPITTQVASDCAAAGIGRVWLWGGAGKGTATPETVGFCESAGMKVVAGECPFMFLSGTGWIHRVHGFVMKIAGAYPA